MERDVRRFMRDNGRRLAAFGLAAVGLASAACSSSSPDGRPSTAAASAAPSNEPSIGIVTPVTTLAPAAVTEAYRDVSLKPGESVTVSGIALVQGDVVVDGKVLYDNDPKTGLLVEINGGTHTVYAQWGADVQAFGNSVDKHAFAATEGNDIELMKANGCDPKPKPGCDSVTVDKIN